MGLLAWLQNFWFELIQSAASGAELLTRRRERIYQRVTNRIIFTQHHREVWTRYASEPALHRIKAPIADLTLTPISLKEHQFVTDVIHHLAACFHASENGVFKMPEAISNDIKTFFALPIPRAVWEMNKTFQDRKFIAFVEHRL